MNHNWRLIVPYIPWAIAVCGIIGMIISVRKKRYGYAMLFLVISGSIILFKSGIITLHDSEQDNQADPAPQTAEGPVSPEKPSSPVTAGETAAPKQGPRRIERWEIIAAAEQMFDADQYKGSIASEGIHDVIAEPGKEEWFAVNCRSRSGRGNNYIVLAVTGATPIKWKMHKLILVPVPDSGKISTADINEDELIDFMGISTISKSGQEAAVSAFIVIPALQKPVIWSETQKSLFSADARIDYRNEDRVVSICLRSIKPFTVDIAGGEYEKLQGDNPLMAPGMNYRCSFKLKEFIWQDDTLTEVHPGEESYSFYHKEILAVQDASIFSDFAYDESPGKCIPW